MKMLDSFVEGHLNLQVKISYQDHHAFLLRHGLNQCSQVLDVGTGNGTFVARLAQDHSNIQFVGIDKRKPCIESCEALKSANLDFALVDMFSRNSTFDFSRFNGFLMRYFLLHVDNAQKILELFKAKAKRPSIFWVIDLDWSQFACEPAHPTFDKLTKLVKNFCSKISVQSLGGQNVVPLLEKMDFKDIKVENIPFTTRTIPLVDLTQYLKQEVLCYSRMGGGEAQNPDTLEIIRFIDEDIAAGKYQISYGMVLISSKFDGDY